ncbi:hypothetical protein Tco_0523643 [Tanacetum coccineum]
MAAVEVPQTLEYRGGQLNVTPVLEMENFTNWKKRFMCHIIGLSEDRSVSIWDRKEDKEKQFCNEDLNDLEERISCKSSFCPNLKKIASKEYFKSDKWDKEISVLDDMEIVVEGFECALRKLAEDNVMWCHAIMKESQ